MQRFPVVGRYHLDRVPGTAVQERAIGAFARTFLTADTKIRINFDAAERRVVFVWDPEHASFNRAILDACRRAGATGATVSGDSEYPWPLLSSSFSVALGHRPVLVYNIEHPFFSLLLSEIAVSRL